MPPTSESPSQSAPSQVAPRQKPPKHIFPASTALALATFALLLYGYRRLIEPSKGLNPAIFAQAWKLKLPHRDLASSAPGRSSRVAPGPLNGIQAPQAAQTQQSSQAAGTQATGAPARGGAPRTPPGSFLTDDSGALTPFFAALHHLELSPASQPSLPKPDPSTGAQPSAAQPSANPSAPVPPSPQAVTILHYGDSPTTADLITGDVRALLQARFGDAGIGFLLPAKPWAWYQHRGVEIEDKDWTVSTAVGKGRPELYGLGGASFTGGPDASSHIALKDAEQATLEVAFLARPDGGTLSVSADAKALDTFSTASAPSQPAHPAWHTFALPPGARSLNLKPAAGSVTIFGEDFRTARQGIVYNALGLNGASTTVLSSGFNESAWAAELQHVHPELIVINYGTNESSFSSFVDHGYEATLRATIARIRRALPRSAEGDTPILIMSPMDRGERSGFDDISTFATIPRIISIQRRVAADQQCAFFDTFDAMGGDGTMARWYTGQPRLVAGDLIHPTPQGASIVARLFVKDLLAAYDLYLRTQSPASKPEASPPPPQPTPGKP